MKNAHLLAAAALVMSASAVNAEPIEFAVKNKSPYNFVLEVAESNGIQTLPNEQLVLPALTTTPVILTKKMEEVDSHFVIDGIVVKVNDIVVDTIRFEAAKTDANSTNMFCSLPDVTYTATGAHGKSHKLITLDYDVERENGNANQYLTCSAEDTFVWVK